MTIISFGTINEFPLSNVKGMILLKIGMMYLLQHLIPVLLIANLNKVFLSESELPICREVTERVISEFDILEKRMYLPVGQKTMQLLREFSVLGGEKVILYAGGPGSQFMIDDWEYPAIGVAICDCPSAGHNIIFQIIGNAACRENRKQFISARSVTTKLLLQQIILRNLFGGL